MHQVQIKAVERKVGDKSTLKKIRSEGFVPAVIYGPGASNATCAVNEKELRTAFKNDLEQNAIIELQSDSASLKGKKVVLKELSRSSVLWNLEHIDLYEISMSRPLKIRVPFHYTGTPDGVKNDGGVIQVLRRTIQIEGLPGELPDFIEVDISALKINEALHINEIKLPQNIKVIDNVAIAIVSVMEPEKEEVATPAAAAAGEGAAAAAGTTAAAGAAAPAAAAPAADAKKK
jgi:large subunit ribosomal protein L25